MKEIKLNFSNCKYIGEIHIELKNKLNFPEYYGKNLDALWDSLCYYTNDELIIKISGFDNIENLFEDYSSKIKGVFQKVSGNCPNIKFEFLSKA